MVMVDTTWFWGVHPTRMNPNRPGEPLQVRWRPAHWSYASDETGLTEDQIKGIKQTIKSSLSDRVLHEAEGHWAEGIPDEDMLAHGVPQWWLDPNVDRIIARNMIPQPVFGPANH